MNIEERILAAKQKIEASENKKEEAVARITYDRVFPSIATIEELSAKKSKKTTLHVRATVNGGKSNSIIKIPLHELIKVPASKKEVIERFATEHFLPELMHLKSDYFEKMKPLCELAVLHNQLAAQKFDDRREKFKHKDGSMIYNSAKPIHELCEWLGEIEGLEMKGVELKADEAQDIQQAAARLESILANMGYESKGFNIEKYQNDEIAEAVDKKYDIISRKNREGGEKTKAQKKAELDQIRAARFANCDEDLLDPISKSSSSKCRDAYEQEKEGRSSNNNSTPSPQAAQN
ncbi:hypothetical protein VAE151_130026 [Vibrio aestuarianus]|uniref:hypothetical protein n=1 Tax=Vibrio aestuarianus TaxID=28171 RepID=UPI00145625A8|nr:hypothetical protein [Vibrio aestuarianus]NLS63550.1 hypothetical protein [Vibrio aestuarianus subsp. francensis]CAH8187941.1 hypothetical protein VAE151_130026 [Vibrio aestuarianus]